MEGQQRPVDVSAIGEYRSGPAIRLVVCCVSVCVHVRR